MRDRTTPGQTSAEARAVPRPWPATVRFAAGGAILAAGLTHAAIAVIQALI